MAYKSKNSKRKFSVIIAVLLGCLIISCHPDSKKPAPADQNPTSGEAKFVFSEEIHNFGALKAGEIVAFTFSFKNEGTKPLIINSADGGCSCTEIKLPEQPIEPGQEGYIEVIYHSAGEVGRQLKTITLFSNAEPENKKLYIKADVKNDIIEINS